MDIDSHTDHLVTGWNPMTLERINEEQPRGPRLMSSAAFITGFMPPDYLIDGILQSRFIYAFTGRTGEGKTSVRLRLAAHVAQGTPPLGRRPLLKGGCSTWPERTPTILDAVDLVAGANVA